MANEKRYMPRKDVEFIAWAKTIYRDCETNAVIWGIDSEQLAQFADLVELADKAFQTNSNREQRNKASVYAKNAAYGNLKRFLQTFINILEGNLKIPDAAITSMGLRPRHRTAYQPIPVPTDTPVITVIVGQHNEIAVYASTLQHGHPAEFLKNEKYAGFLLKYRFEDAPQWQFVISTRLHYTLLFNDSDKGKYLLLQGAWLNPRMQNGPWSEEVRELIN
ncbi:MAG: hypothetical protein LBC20_13945 [Planctomycetaceae bacterium]|jgi:hypothetical protein|nr:hypothetical protein [Planctomycetaceae bacterium]